MLTSWVYLFVRLIAMKDSNFPLGGHFKRRYSPNHLTKVMDILQIVCPP